MVLTVKKKWLKHEVHSMPIERELEGSTLPDVTLLGAKGHLLEAKGCFLEAKGHSLGCQGPLTKADTHVTFKHPFTMIVAAPTGFGKTVYVYNLL